MIYKRYTWEDFNERPKRWVVIGPEENVGQIRKNNPDAHFDFGGGNKHNPTGRTEDLAWQINPMGRHWIEAAENNPMRCPPELNP